jgi:hypothetical protein
VAGHHWQALFRRLRGMDFLWILVFFVLNILVTLVSGSIIVNFFEHSTNPAGDTVAVASAGDKVLFFARTGIQLIVLASLAVAVIFALAHIHTYDGHLAQALIGVGVARLVLLIPVRGKGLGSGTVSSFFFAKKLDT